jgi:hypothetical protein
VRTSEAGFCALAFFWLDGFAVPAHTQVGKPLGGTFTNSQRAYLDPHSSASENPIDDLTRKALMEITGPLIIISLALVFYSIGVWSERFEADSKRGIWFSFGLVLFATPGVLA